MKRFLSLSIIVISFFKVYASSRIYDEPCVFPSTRADWERVGVRVFSSANIATIAVPASGLALSSGTPSSSRSYPRLPATILLPMSPVKDQLDHGFCTAFAVAACIEGLMHDIKVSEAELIIRLKTEGDDDNIRDGSHLHKYVPLLRKGFVLEQHFPTYAAFSKYVDGRKSMAKRGQIPPRSPLIVYSPNYRESIEELVLWCWHTVRWFRYRVDYYRLPEIIKPSWNEEGEQVSPVRADPCPTKLNKYVPLPTMGDRIRSLCAPVDTDKIVLDPDSYYPVRFNMQSIVVCEPRHPSGDPLYNLKHWLIQRAPIAISIETFAKYTVDREGNKSVEETWLETAPTAMNRYTIEVPSLASGFKLYGAHAICLCGYDNERRAFRFKNSYGIGYADQGCAWISYGYIAKHTIDEEAFAITIDHR